MNLSIQGHQRPVGSAGRPSDLDPSTTHVLPRPSRAIESSIRQFRILVILHCVPFRSTCLRGRYWSAEPHTSTCSSPSNASYEACDGAPRRASSSMIRSPPRSVSQWRISGRGCVNHLNARSAPKSGSPLTTSQFNIRTSVCRRCRRRELPGTRTSWRLMLGDGCHVQSARGFARTVLGTGWRLSSSARSSGQKIPLAQRPQSPTTSIRSLPSVVVICCSFSVAYMRGPAILSPTFGEQFILALPASDRHHWPWSHWTSDHSCALRWPQLSLRKKPRSLWRSSTAPNGPSPRLRFRGVTVRAILAFLPIRR